MIRMLTKFASTKSSLPDLQYMFEIAREHIGKNFGVAAGNKLDFTISIKNFDPCIDEDLQKELEESKALIPAQPDAEDPFQLDQSKQEFYLDSYGLKIEPKSIKIDLTKLFRLFMQGSCLDRESIFQLMDILIPLFRDIPFAGPIIAGFKNLVNGNKDQIFNSIASIVHIALVLNLRNAQELLGDSVPIEI